MGNSEWSSNVCSSDLPALAFGPANLDRLLRLEAVPFRSVRYGSRRPRRGAAREHGGWKDQTPEFAHIHPPKSKPALHEQRGFFDQLSAINHLLILEFSNGTPATTTVWRSSPRNPCLAKKPSAERLTWADSFRSPRSSEPQWTCCMRSAARRV